MKELMHAIHESMNMFVLEVSLFPVLRFIPPFRERVKILNNKLDKLMKLVAQQVRL